MTTNAIGTFLAHRNREAALNAHSARMANIAELHNLGMVTDEYRDEKVQRSWDEVIASAIRYDFQV
jgi:hypothetical protein